MRVFSVVRCGGPPARGVAGESDLIGDISRFRPAVYGETCLASLRPAGPGIGFAQGWWAECLHMVPAGSPKRLRLSQGM